MRLGNIKNFTPYADVSWTDWFSTEGFLDDGDKTPPFMRLRYLTKISIITKQSRKNIHED